MPLASSSPGFITSSPVENTATLSGFRTLNETLPVAAANPISCGLNRVPASSTRVPAAISSPNSRLLDPRFIPGGIITFSFSNWMSSCIRTVSGSSACAPFGITAPVKILTASPLFCIRLRGLPAAAFPITGNSVVPVLLRSSKKIE